MTEIAYYPGCTANYVDPAIGISTIQVLEKHGFEPVALDQKCCGIPYLGVGDLKGFLKRAEFNARLLAETDCDIVTACTSCTLAIKQDYPKYLRSPEAEEVSRRTYDIMEYLTVLRAQGLLENSFHPVDFSLMYHAPCHLSVLGQELIDSRLELMRLIPGLSIRQSRNGCCGMGGIFGSKKKSYEKSMEIGEDLFNEIKETAPDMVITDCPGCQLQINQGTGLEVMHPIQIIRRAYGL
ncbi:heterodisulfide reductase-related iron-sulfur binding cluster [Chloroflexota bacterium]